MRRTRNAGWLAAALMVAGCGRESRGRTKPPENDARNERVTADSAPPPADGPVAFPGAEGFGAKTRGGRGGSVCTVTSLAKAGPGSLADCVDRPGPRIVVFAVSGVIPGPIEIRHGKLTIAGQTSPSGIVIDGGLVCDNVYDPNDCNDVILRHLRLRRGAPDGLRIGGAHDILVDHCSIAGAADENVEITRSRRVTVQNTIIAEPAGDHYKWGGVLINYSKDAMPLDEISLHHNLWSGVSGRLPEISCEENDDGPGKSNCSGRVVHLEISHNVYWDVYDPIWFNRCTGTNQGNDCAPSPRDVRIALNLVGNVMARRSAFDPDLPFVEPALVGSAGNEVFARDNLLLRSSQPSPASLASRGKRHAYPPITATGASDLVRWVAQHAGARPSDAMDRRLLSYLGRSVDERPRAWTGEHGIDPVDALVLDPPKPAPVDTDGDGMPDAWESAHGLDPRVANPDDLALAGKLATCPAGTGALACYLNELAER